MSSVRLKGDSALILEVLPPEDWEFVMTLLRKAPRRAGDGLRACGGRSAKRRDPVLTEPGRPSSRLCGVCVEAFPRSKRCVGARTALEGGSFAERHGLRTWFEGRVRAAIGAAFGGFAALTLGGAHLDRTVRELLRPLVGLENPARGRGSNMGYTASSPKGGPARLVRSNTRYSRMATLANVANAYTTFS